MSQIESTLHGEPRTWWRPSPREDVSAVVGLQSGRLVIAALLVWAGFLLLGLTDPGVDVAAGYAAAFAAFGVAWAIPLRAPGVPLAWWSTAVVVVAELVGAVGAVASVSADLSRGPVIPVAGATTILGALLCLRGRVGSAWVSLVLLAAVLAVTGLIRGRSFDYVVVILPGDVAIVVLMSVFAAIIGPRAEEIFALRRHSQRDGAAIAARAVRDQQLARLDDRVRPLLQRIAAGKVLSGREIAQCRLIEAQLRDRIRAPALDVPELSDGVWAARSRGVRVLLLDDGPRAAVAADDRRDEILAPVRAAAVEALRAAPVGADVTVRILPVGRASVATLSVAVDGVVSLSEFR